MTDSRQLLADYSRNHSETAFHELVARYLNLVYSTAFRLVDGDAHRAEDVTQIVFTDLAKKAHGFTPDVMLGGWLHRHTCFVAANTMRGERRRLVRERHAAEMNLTQQESRTDFSKLAPILDEAINELEEADRTAILLRFFEQQDFRSVGKSLANSEDAARMRVNRALEKLRELLQRRGITTTAAALSAVISAHAVQAAPTGLAVTISSAALAATAVSTATVTTTVAATTKTIAMTAIQKALVTTTVVVLAGAGIYEAHNAAQLRHQVQTLRQNQEPLEEQILQLKQERDEATRRLAALRQANERLNRNSEELLRLRGMAGAAQRSAAETQELRAQLARQAAEATNNPVASAMGNVMNQAMELQVDGRLSRLVNVLHLTDQQTHDAREILMRQAQAMSAGMQQAFSGKYDKEELARLSREAGNPDEQIKALLTPDQLATYPAYQQEEAAYNASLAANQELVQMQATLGLTTEQVDRAYLALYELNFNQITGSSKQNFANQGDAIQWSLEQKSKALEPILTDTQFEDYRQQLELQTKLANDIMNQMEGSGNTTPSTE